jgi:hypothetical protein
MLYRVLLQKRGSCNDSLAVGAKYGITTNAITWTFPTKGAWDRLMPGDLAEKFDMQKVPLQRVGDHQELANLAIWFLLM